MRIYLRFGLQKKVVCRNVNSGSVWFDIWYGDPDPSVTGDTISEATCRNRMWLTNLWCSDHGGISNVGEFYLNIDPEDSPCY
jgi:hypothetical protein